MYDIHIHTRFSFDSEELPEKYIESAQKNDINVIGFSEHYDYDAILDGAKNVSLVDIPSYLKNAEELEKRFPAVKILRGIEVGYSDVAVPRYREIAEKYPFDYIINSVHTLPNRGDCYYASFFDGLTIKRAYTDYFKAVLKSIDAPFDYQIIGHVGYVSRYRTEEERTIRYADYAGVLEEILKEIIRKDKCLEINASAGTSGSTFLPDTDIIEKYLQFGGRKLSYGSDAHAVAAYMQKSEKLYSYLKSVGVDELYYYENRQPVKYKI